MAQPRTQLENVRRRLPHYLEPSVGLCAGLRLDELQQVVAGTLIPNAEQLNALSRRMQLPVYPNTKATA
jgi:hypothetical protein